MKKRKHITFKVWLEIERYNEKTGDGQDMDAPGSSLATFDTFEEAWDYAARVTALAAVIILSGLWIIKSFIEESFLKSDPIYANTCDG